LCSNFIKFVQQEIGEIVYYLVDKKNKILTVSQTVVTAWITPKICQSQPPTMYSRVLQISFKLVHFWQSYS